MKTLFKQFIAAVLLSGLLSGTGYAEEAEEGAQDLDLRGSDCILIRTIRDYTPLDDRTLLIRGSARRSYFVTLQRPAFGMRSSFRLGFSSRDSQLCPYGGDAIVLDGIGEGRVRVQYITRLTEAQAEDILVRYGKKTPAEPPTHRPGTVKGAEVEELG